MEAILSIVTDRCTTYVRLAALALFTLRTLATLWPFTALAAAFAQMTRPQGFLDSNEVRLRDDRPTAILMDVVLTVSRASR